MDKLYSDPQATPYLDSRIPPDRLDFLVRKCREILCRVPGNVLEVGVYKGGSLVRLAETVKDICPQFVVFGIDTFTGHLYTDGHPAHPTGKYSDVSYAKLESEIVSRGLGRWVKLFKGAVEDILSSLQLPSISFAHIDCDLYLPVRFCAVEVPKLIPRGGMVYFDDYDHADCPGATVAVNEVFRNEQVTKVSLQGEQKSYACFIEL